MSNVSRILRSASSAAASHSPRRSWRTSFLSLRLSSKWIHENEIFSYYMRISSLSALFDAFTNINYSYCTFGAILFLFLPTYSIHQTYLNPPKNLSRHLTNCLHYPLWRWSARCRSFPDLRSKPFLQLPPIILSLALRVISLAGVVVVLLHHRKRLIYLRDIPYCPIS